MSPTANGCRLPVLVPVAGNDLDEPHETHRRGGL